MANFFPTINPKLQKFITSQKIFFVATADISGRVNLSPKGIDTLRVPDENRIIWLNLTGSGNETAAHIMAVNRITLMFCAFEQKPLIVRIYGSASIIHPDNPLWDDLLAQFPTITGVRQIFDIQVQSAQTSCGWGVPYFSYHGERNELTRWTEKQGEDGIKKYWEERNQLSIDGKPTDL